MFNADIGEAIKVACSNTNDDDIIHLERAAHNQTEEGHICQR